MADFNRREFLTAATLAGASAMVFGSPAHWPQRPSAIPAVRKAAEAGRDAAIKRIQDWIALPSIAAENRNMKEGAEYMATLAREAGFDTADDRADRRPSRRLRHDGQRREAHARPVLHVRRQAVRSGRMVLAAARRADRRQARIRPRHRRSRRRQSEGTRGHRARRASCHARGQGETPGQPRAGRRRRGGNRLAALSPDRAAPRDLRRAQEGRGHLHSRELAGHERQRRRQSRLQGHHRAGAGRERREVGSRSEGRHSLQPEGDGRLAGLASGARR